MYNMEVESPLFIGKTLVAQHRMVNEARVGLLIDCPKPEDAPNAIIDRPPSFSFPLHARCWPRRLRRCTACPSRRGRPNREARV